MNLVNFFFNCSMTTYACNSKMFSCMMLCILLKKNHTSPNLRITQIAMQRGSLYPVTSFEDTARTSSLNFHVFLHLFLIYHRGFFIQGDNVPTPCKHLLQGMVLHPLGLNEGYKLSLLSPSQTVLYAVHAVSSPK